DATRRGRVTPISERVNEDAIETVPRGEPQESEEVARVGMDAAVADQSHDVERAAAFQAALNRGGEGRIGKEGAVPDGEIDPGDPLVDDEAGTEVQVPNLGVPHLAVWETDRL